MSHLDDSTHITNPSYSMEDIDFEQAPPLSSLNAPIIDFDAASAAWMANKVRKGAMVYYRCTAIQKNGCQCPKAVLNPTPTDLSLCKMHSRSVTKALQSLPGDKSDARSANSP